MLNSCVCLSIYDYIFNMHHFEQGTDVGEPGGRLDSSISQCFDCAVYE